MIIRDLFLLEIDKEYIQDILPYEELLCQLAEEASELAKAALKLRRAVSGTNPTPVTEEEATKKLIEEFADVLLCCVTLDLHDEEVMGKVIEIMRDKQDRWIVRVEKKRESEEN